MTRATKLIACALVGATSFALLGVPKFVVSAGASPCDPVAGPRTDDFFSAYGTQGINGFPRWDGVELPAYGKGSTVTGGVYSTIDTYSNYTVPSPGGSSLENYDVAWSWVMLVDDGNLDKNTGYAQIGPATGSWLDYEPNLTNFKYAYNWQTNNEPIVAVQVSGPSAPSGADSTVFTAASLGGSDTYTTLLDAIAGAPSDNYSFYLNSATQPLAVGPGGETYIVTGAQSDEAQVNGETHTGADQMFGDVLQPQNFANTQVYQNGTWGGILATTSAVLSTAQYSEFGYLAYGTTPYYGFQKVSSTQFSIWDNACPYPIGTTSTTTGNGNYLDMNNLLDTQYEPGESSEVDFNLISPAGASNGPFRLAIQPPGSSGGNIMVYNAAGDVLWTPGIVTSNPDYLIMQSDGNLVLYDGWGRTPLWNSGTGGQGSGSYLVMQSDGNLVLFNSSGTPTWQTSTNWDSTNSALLYGQNLYEGSQIYSENGGYHLAMQTDGNLVLYSSSGAVIWSTGTWNSKDCPAGDSCVIQLDMQTDGNLVLYSYDENTGALSPMCWANGTYGTGSFNHMLVNNDGTVTVQTVTQTGSQSVWSSTSSPSCVIGGDL